MDSAPSSPSLDPAANDHATQEVVREVDIWKIFHVHASYPRTVITLAVRDAFERARQRGIEITEAAAVSLADRFLREGVISRDNREFDAEDWRESALAAYWEVRLLENSEPLITDQMEAIVLRGVENGQPRLMVENEVTTLMDIFLERTKNHSIPEPILERMANNFMDYEDGAFQLYDYLIEPRQFIEYVLSRIEREANERYESLEEAGLCIEQLREEIRETFLRLFGIVLKRYSEILPDFGTGEGRYDSPEEILDALIDVWAARIPKAPIN